MNEETELITLAKEGLIKRLKTTEFQKNEISISKQTYLDRLDYELEIINRMGFAGYFLIVADFVQWAKRNNIPVIFGYNYSIGN